jgi:hypothetical protein
MHLSQKKYSHGLIGDGHLSMKGIQRAMTAQDKYLICSVMISVSKNHNLKAERANGVDRLTQMYHQKNLPNRNLKSQLAKIVNFVGI